MDRFLRNFDFCVFGPHGIISQAEGRAVWKCADLEGLEAWEGKNEFGLRNLA